jgi:Pro-kumamolisin, activation domain
MNTYIAFARASLGILLTALLGMPLMAQQRRALAGHIPAEAAHATSVGRLPATTPLNLALGLPLRNQAALTALLQDISDPSSPNYRRYLTPEQFDERFGPTEADYQAVIAFAQAHGLAVTGTHSNRMVLDVAGSVADVEGAFQTTLRTYQHPTEARSYYAPDTEPSVEANVPVADISGLSNLRLPHPKLRKPVPLAHGAKAIPPLGSSPFGMYFGNDYRAAYAPGVALKGAGQSLGLFEFDGYYATDISQYESLAGLPAVTLQNVLLDSFDGSPGSANSEVALDIEMAISMAPGLSKVVVYEAGPYGLANDVLSAMTANTAVKQFSCSWDFGTTPRATMDSLFQKMGVQGQTFFNAAGDGGAFTGSWPQPDDDPYITLVGGTTLATSAPSGAWLSETAWNAGDGVNSTSGGFSSNYPIASYATWQQGISMSANHGSTTMRNIPDVAMIADAVFIVADDGQEEVTGGTSAASPLWASLTALANQQAALAGQGSLGFINPAIYALGKSARYSSVFNDPTSGNNTNGVATQFFAVPGYDLCTGWGAPAGSSLILALATPDRFVISPAAAVTANGPVGGPFSTTAQSLSLSNGGTTSLNWSLGNVPPWLNASAVSGTLAPGAAASTVTLALNPAVASQPAGVYTANLLFTNNTTGFVQTRQFTVQVGQDLVQDGGFEVGDFAYWTLFGSHATDNSFVDDGTYTDMAPYDGTYFAALGATNGLNYMTQTLPTRAGQLYLLSFWLQSTNYGDGTTPSQFQVNWGGASVYNKVNLGAFGWTQMQYVVPGAASSTMLEFGFRDDPAYLGLDDVSVLPISAPVFLSAGASGGTVNLTWTTMPGASYQLQYKTDVTAATWINLGGALLASGNTLSASDVIGSNSKRLYRVVLTVY